MGADEKARGLVPSAPRRVGLESDLVEFRTCNPFAVTPEVRVRASVRVPLGDGRFSYWITCEDAAAEWLAFLRPPEDRLDCFGSWLSLPLSVKGAPTGGTWHGEAEDHVV